MMKHKKIIFIWRGLDSQHQKISGEILAFNIRLAKLALNTKQFQLKKIYKKSFLSQCLRSLKKNLQRITQKDMSFFFRQLATLLDAQIPLAQALHITEKNSSKSDLKQLLSNIRKQLESGFPLSYGLQQTPRYFDALTCQLIIASEQSGTLDVMLDRIATNKERSLKLKNKIKKALFYPCLVALVAVITLTILMLWVIPQFNLLFSQAHVPLPALTQFVITCSQGLQQTKWFIVLLFLFGTPAFILLKRKNVIFDNWINRFLFRLPLLGKLLQKNMIAQFYTTLAMTTQAGLPLLDAIQLTTKLSTHQIYRETLQQIQQSIQQGQSLHAALQDCLLFPQLAVQMVAIGEEAGKLDDMLKKTADFYEAEVNQLTEQLSQLAEPLIMLTLGIMVGILVIAMYLPIFKLGTVI